MPKEDTAVAKSDIFPTNLSDPDTLRNLPKLNISQVMAKKNLLPFITYLEGHKIYYRAQCYNNRLKDHFSHFEKYFFTSREEKHKYWSKIHRRLNIPPTDKQNTDTRQSFKYDENFFVVKSFFTTGVRHVQPEEVHCYQVGPFPLFLYTITQQAALNNGMKIEERSFVEKEQSRYSFQKLEKLKNYIIPSNTYYVLNTFSPAYFAVHRLRFDSEIAIDFVHIKNPKEKKAAGPPLETTLEASSSNLEPATPLIEDLRMYDTHEDQNSDGQDSTDYEDEDASRMPPPATPATATDCNPRPTTSTASATVSSTASSTATSTTTAPEAPTVTVTFVPLNRTIKVVDPDKIAWYQSMFTFQQRGPPPDPEVLETLCTDKHDQENALDLSPRKRFTPEPASDTSPVKCTEQACQTETPFPELEPSELDAFFNQFCSDDIVYKVAEALIELSSSTSAEQIPAETLPAPAPMPYPEETLPATQNFTELSPVFEPMDTSAPMYSELTPPTPRDSAVYPPVNSNLELNQVLLSLQEVQPEFVP